MSVHRLPRGSEFTWASGGPQNGVKMTWMDILEFRDIDGPDPVNGTPKTDLLEVLEETLCTICASPIENYVPKYFLTERFRPACEKCDDNSEMSD